MVVVVTPKIFFFSALFFFSLENRVVIPLSLYIYFYLYNLHLSRSTLPVVFLSRKGPSAILLRPEKKLSAFFPRLLQQLFSFYLFFFFFFFFHHNNGGETTIFSPFVMESVGLKEWALDAISSSLDRDAARPNVE